MNLLNKVTVRARIITLFVLFILLFTLFGLFALQRNSILGDLTMTLYEHPLQVSNAAQSANAGVLRMHRGMKDLALAQSELELQLAIQTVLGEELKVYQDLERVRERILGAEGKQLILETIEVFAGWKSIRLEVEELALKGDKLSASKITRQKGADYVAGLERQMQALASYAHRKADGFMASAVETQSQVRSMVVGGVVLLSLSCLLMAAVVISSITGALALLKNKMSAITDSGEMDQVELSGNNEINDLAAHFNALVSMIRDQLWLRNSINSLNRELSGDLSNGELADASLSFVATTIGACSGALYTVDLGDLSCRLTSSYAFVERSFLANHFASGEGIIGQIAKDRKPILLKNISREDACANSGTVSAAPYCIYAVPILFEQKLLAVMEVASFEAIGELQKQFVDEAATVIASQLNSAVQNRQIKDLFHESQQANEFLQAKSDEIKIKNDELGAVNKELQAQSEELQGQRDELQAQAGELNARRIEVEEADRLKSEFLSNMSHELRTPLNSILSLSQLILKRGSGKNPEKTDEFIQVIDRNGRHLLSLINDILDLTKIEAGRMEILPAEFSTEQLVERLLETISPLAKEKRLKLEKDIGPPIDMFSDEEKVFQILLNFLSNAIKFSEQGAVRITLRDLGKRVSFAISDSGIGISTVDLTNVFDEFRQVDGSFTREHEGTGLGLAISKKLAILLDGDISAESTPDVGSTFTLVLPKSHRSDAPSETLPEIISVPNFEPRVINQQPTVLIIDDEGGIRTELQTYLLENDYRVITASSGREGLQLARKNQPDVISLDLLMPNMDGWEVLRHLKTDPETVAIPVIITSVSRDENTGMALGSAGYVPKPVVGSFLLEEIRRVTNREQAKRVLIVDDDQGVREFLSDFLQDAGFSVETAANGRLALELIGHSVPQLVILDLMMPEVNGFTLLEQLRQNPATSSLPVIILTTRDLTENDCRLLASANHTVKKEQLDKPAFLQQIEEALAGRTQSVSDDPNRSRRVLVIEDNDIAIMQITTALEENGIEVDVAKDGAEGLTLLARNHPDALVLDLMMPKIDGFQVLQQIRSRAETATLPVLVLTAKELSSAERKQLVDNNIQQLVQKGATDRDQLVASVQKMLVAKPSLPTFAASARTTSYVAASGPRKILVVEDNPDNRLTIAEILEGQDAVLLYAEDGQEGVDIARDKLPDLILMDIQLPVINGIDATKLLKNDARTKGIPIIAVTARAMCGDQESVLADGLDDYISKPIDPAAMLAMINRWMD